MEEATKTPESPVPAAEPVKVEVAETEKKILPMEDKSVDPERGKADPLLDGYYKNNPFFYEVASLFNVPSHEQEQAAPKLSVIVDYVTSEFKTEDPGEILLKIKELENKIQPPSWGEKRYNNLYKYIRLAGQKSSVEKAMKAFERNPNG